MERVSQNNRRHLIVGIGEGVNLDGWLTLNSILVAAKVFQLLRNGEADIALFSGKGNHAHLDVERPTDAGAMKEWIRSLGVEESKIMIDERSTDTFGDAYYSKLIAMREGFNSILLVAGPWHMERALWLFKMTYGPGYSIMQRPSEGNGFPERERAFAQMAEEVSLRLYKLYFEQAGIVRGDHEAMLRVMMKKSEVYTKNPDWTPEQRELIEKLRALRSAARVVR